LHDHYNLLSQNFSVFTKAESNVPGCAKDDPAFNSIHIANAAVVILLQLFYKESDLAQLSIFYKFQHSIFLPSLIDTKYIPADKCFTLKE
jgi:hypothetical protein